MNAMTFPVHQKRIDQIIEQPSARSIDLLWDQYRVISDDQGRDEFVGALIGTLVVLATRHPHEKGAE